jgi:hypothetical protein
MHKHLAIFKLHDACGSAHLFSLSTILFCSAIEKLYFRISSQSLRQPKRGSFDLARVTVPQNGSDLFVYYLETLNLSPTMYFPVLFNKQPGVASVSPLSLCPPLHRCSVISRDYSSYIEAESRITTRSPHFQVVVEVTLRVMLKKRFDLRPSALRIAIRS